MPRKRKQWRFYQRKLKNGNIYYVMFRAMPGKWISTGTEDRDEAERWAANYEVTIAPDAQITLAEFTENSFIPGRCMWLRRMQAKGRTFSTQHIKKMRG